MQEKSLASAKHAPAWDLTFNKEHAKEILTLLRPYLRVKKPQAELVLEFIEMCRPHGHGNMPSIEHIALQSVLYEESRELNKRGV